MICEVMADLICHLSRGLSFWHGDLMMCKAICKKCSSLVRNHKLTRISNNSLEKC